MERCPLERTPHLPTVMPPLKQIPRSSAAENAKLNDSPHKCVVDLTTQRGGFQVSCATVPLICRSRDLQLRACLAVAVACAQDQIFRSSRDMDGDLFAGFGVSAPIMSLKPAPILSMKLLGLASPDSLLGLADTAAHRRHRRDGPRHLMVHLPEAEGEEGGGRRQALSSESAAFVNRSADSFY